MANWNAGDARFQIIIAIALLTTSYGCRKQTLCDVPSAISDGTAAPWESLALSGTKSQWESLFDPAKEWGDERDSMFQALDDVLSTNLSEEDLRKLAASANSSPLKSPHDSKFLDYLVAYMIVNFVHSGDRESLVNLLAARCPDEIYPFYGVECYVALYGKDKLDSPILVFAEAFRKCKEPTVRHKIACALRRAFAGSGLHWTSDEDFVKKCSAWYLENRDRIIINMEYFRNGKRYQPYVFEELPELYEPEVKSGTRRQILFELKPSPEVGASSANKLTKVSPKESSTSAVATNSVHLSKPNDKNADSGLASLLGTWNLVEEIRGEERTPDASLKGEHYIISDGTMSFIAPRLEKPFDYGLTVCADAEPHTINLRTWDQKHPKWQWTIRGIYRLDGDNLQICLAPYPGGPRPTEFKTRRPWNERLLTLKRVK